MRRIADTRGDIRRQQPWRVDERREMRVLQLARQVAPYCRFLELSATTSSELASTKQAISDPPSSMLRSAEELRRG
jgi:hypothetical protein